ncbi:hypothetical protein [Mesobacillus foraminis]|nr:hypothetical protein [Mesobacillus foraminis]
MKISKQEKGISLTFYAVDPAGNKSKGDCKIIIEMWSNKFAFFHY